MTTLSTPLTSGAALPALALTTADGTDVPLDTLAPEGRAVLYLMRTSTCPVCHQHLRHLETLVRTGALTIPVVVLVPGGAQEAAAVARRHPALASLTVASESAHAALGLFVKVGLQQSGTYVVDHGRITYARFATVPLGSFDAKETLAAL